MAAVPTVSKATTESGVPHLAILFAVVGDVVLAGFSGPLHNFLGEQTETVLRETRSNCGRARVRESRRASSRSVVIILGAPDCATRTPEISSMRFRLCSITSMA